MKKCLLFLLISILGAKASFGQENVDTIPPYLKTKKLPSFFVLQTDSTLFSTVNVPKGKYTVVMYFSPTCSHCEHEVKEISKKMDSLGNAFFVLPCYHDLNEVKDFVEKYKLKKFKNMVIGKDIKYFCAPFYKIEFTPFIAIYNPKGEFVKAFKDGVEMKDLIPLVQ